MFSTCAGVRANASELPSVGTMLAFPSTVNALVVAGAGNHRRRQRRPQRADLVGRLGHALLQKLNAQFRRMDEAAGS